MNEEEIFHEALARSSPEERAAYLEQACAGAPALRAGVEALLRANVGASGFLDQPAAATVAAIDERPAQERPGAAIGPYKLLEQIGEGGMGTVWMAQQTEPVKRVVALKLIKAGMDSKQIIARFEAERQALALMDHANIARVLDAGATSAGRPYFVMDLVKGVPITKYCDEHHLTPRQRLELFVPVCHAIQHAHQKGIIHRDLKPSNVLVAHPSDPPLAKGGPGGVPKVIDFGVAKATGQSLTDKTLVTGFGNIVGTLEYMSPEQAEINQLDIDTRSDIYSLGVLLYELLTGSPPFSRTELEKAGMLEMLRVIREQEPSKPSTKLSTAEGLPTLAANRGTEPAKLTKLVRGELDWIVMKALEKDRNRRYETANGFAMDVQRYLADEHVLACPPSAGYRLRKFARRNKAALTMAALVAALLLLAVGVLAVANYEINDALTAKSNALAERSKAYDELGIAKHETEKANTDLKATLTALSEEQRETKRALDKERLTLYYHGIALAHREWSANNVARADHILNECPPALRHWEWHYLKRLCNAELFTLRGHEGQIACVAYSPDGEWIASADGVSIRIWDAVRGTHVRTLPGASKVAFSPDSRRLARTHKGGITLWRLGPDAEVLEERTIAAFTGGADSVAFSPDGSRVAAGGREDVAKIFDSETGREVLALPLDRPKRVNVAFSPDGRLLATTAIDSTTRVWDAATGEEKPGDWQPVSRASSALAFSPDSKFLATGQEEAVSLWNLNSGKRSLRLTGHTGLVTRVAYSPDGRHLASTDLFGRVVRIWDLTTPEKPVVTLRGHTDQIYGIAYSPDGLRLASAGRDKTVRVWSARHPPEALGLSSEGAGRVAYSARSERLAAVCYDIIWVWDARTGRELARRKIEPSRSNSRLPVALSPDGRQVVSTGGDETTLRLWDVETQKEPRVIGQHEKAVSVTFSPDGTRLASGAHDGSIQLWDPAIGKQLATLAGHSSTVMQVEFSPDGRRLASASLDGTAKLWDVAAGRELATLRGHGRVRCVAFSSDGKRLATGGDDTTVTLWDAVTGQELYSFHGHGSVTHTVALSPDGLRLAAGLDDGSVILWDTVNKRQALTLQASAAITFSVAFSGDGARLITNNEEIRIWNGSPWTDKAPIALAAEDLGDWTYWRDLAKSMASVKRWQEAVAYYSRAIDLKSDDACCWNARGVAYRGLDQKEKALADYVKASELNPKEPMYWYYRGSVHAELGQHDRAVADYSEAIKLMPENALFWSLRGVAYTWLDQKEKALADHIKASQLKPKEPTYWHYRGTAHAGLGQHDRAVADYSEAIKLKPDDALYWNARGVAYGRLKQMEKALADHIKASELNPKAPTFWYIRGSAHAELGQHDKAVADYSEAIKLKADNAGYWNARGVAYGRLNQQEKALADYIKASELNPKVPAYWYNRGSVHVELGQHDKAVADFSEAIKLKADDAKYWNARGVAYSRLDQKEKALADCIKASELNPKEPTYWYNRGSAQAKLGQWNEALADHAKAAELKPTVPLYHSSQGFACAQLGQWEKAAALFEHATTLKPHYPLAWYYLAMLELRRDDRAGYRKACSRMLERFGQTASAEAAYWTAWTCVPCADAVADWAKPLQLAEKAHAGDGKSFEKIHSLGAVLYRAGRFKEAAKRLTEAEAAFQHTPSTRSTIVYNWLFQAMTHQRLGRSAEAASWLEKAVRAIDEPAPESAQDPAANWNRRLTLQLLRREAEELLAKKSQ